MSKITPSMKELINAEHVQIDAATYVDLLNLAYGTYKRCNDIIDMCDNIRLDITSYDDGEGIGNIWGIKQNAVKTIHTLLNCDEYDEIGDVLHEIWEEDPESETLTDKAVRKIIKYLDEMDTEG